MGDLTVRKLIEVLSGEDPEAHVYAVWDGRPVPVAGVMIVMDQVELYADGCEDDFERYARKTPHDRVIWPRKP